MATKRVTFPTSVQWEPTAPSLSTTFETASTGGMKDAGGKPAVDQLPPHVLLRIGSCWSRNQKPAGKYEKGNWAKGCSWSALYGAILRHLFKWFMGEDIDPESGEHHLIHAGNNILMLADNVLRSVGDDDRTFKG